MVVFNVKFHITSSPASKPIMSQISHPLPQDKKISPPLFLLLYVVLLMVYVGRRTFCDSSTFRSSEIQAVGRYCWFYRFRNFYISKVRISNNWSALFVTTLTEEVPTAFRDDAVHLFISPISIGSVPSIHTRYSIRSRNYCLAIFVHCQESAGARPVIAKKVVAVTGAAL